MENIACTIVFCGVSYLLPEFDELTKGDVPPIWGQVVAVGLTIMWLGSFLGAIL